MSRQPRPTPPPTLPEAPASAPNPPQRRYEKSKRAPAPPRASVFPPLWSVVMMILVVGLMVACAVLALLALGGKPAPAAPPQIVILSAQPEVIVPPTVPAPATPTIPAALDPTLRGTLPAISLIGPTLPPVVFTPTPLVIAVGVQVVVADAGPSGLNVRSAPGRENAVRFVAQDGQIFDVIGGPSQSDDGLVWWQVQNPRDLNQNGWAASVYLQALPAATP